MTPGNHRCRRELDFAVFVVVAMLGYFPGLGQLRIQNFGIAQGLPQSQVSAISEDNDGYLWIGTLGGGLTRFDGQTFETFTSKDGLVNNFVRDLLIDSIGRVWVATNKGISVFDGTKFHSLEIDGAQGGYVTNLFTTRGNIVFMLDNGQTGTLLYGNELHYARTDSLKAVLSVERSPSGGAYILHKPEGALILSILGKSGLTNIEVGSAFTRIHSVLSMNGQDVLSTNGGLFCVINGKTECVESYRSPVYGYNEETASFVGVHQSKLSLINPRTGALKEMDSIRYIILTSYTDRDGTLWLGTDQGLFKIYPVEFENPLRDRARLDAVQAICSYDKKLWIGTAYRGIKVYSQNFLVRNYDFDDIRKNYITAMKTDRTGRLWIGSSGGLSVYDHGRFIWQFPSLIKSTVAFAFDRNNNILVGGAGRGLYQVLDGKASEIRGLGAAGVWCINYNEAGDYFVIGTTAGLKIFRDGVIKPLNIPDFEAKEISSVGWLDSQTLMLGTLGDGIFIYSFATGTVSTTISKGLLSNTIFSLFVDGESVWVGSEKGIDLIAYDRNGKRVTKIDHFNDTNGLEGLETNLNAVYRADNVLLFGLMKGLYAYRRTRSLTENKLHLKSIGLFYESVGEGKMVQTGSPTAEYVFNHGQNHITFTYNKVNKRYPENYYYTYRLDNFDRIWSRASQSKSVTYGNLSPGSYTFEVRATDRDDAFIFDDMRVKFTIRPAYYQTRWFKSLIALLMLLLVTVVAYWIYTAKARRLHTIQMLKDQEQLRLRKEIARDFHDELGNQVARLLNYVSLLHISEQMEKKTYGTLHGYAQSILTGTKDFVWALDPRNDDLESVLIHLRDFGERMFSEKAIDFSFYGEFKKIALPIGYGRQINLIFKEAMTNAFRHSGAKSVEFGVQAESGNRFFIYLRDDGVGFAKEVISNSNHGLENMKMRALRIRSAIQILSNGKGVLVTLAISNIPQTL